MMSGSLQVCNSAVLNLSNSHTQRESGHSSRLYRPRTQAVPIITLAGRALAVTVNHQRRGQGPHAHSDSVGELIPAVLSGECFFGARKASPCGGCKALGLGTSTLMPPGGCPSAGDQGQRCSRTPPEGCSQPLRLPVALGGHTPTGETSGSLERWRPKQLDEEPLRRRCSQHQAPQHRDSCSDSPVVPAPVLPAPVLATSNMAAAARSKTPRSEWNDALPHGSGSPQR